MKRIFVTGISGTGKSSVFAELRSRGFSAIDTDYDNWCEQSILNGESEWLLREDRMNALLSAPLEVMLERVAKRTSNSYGKSEKERAEICWNFRHIQPLLRNSANIEIDSAIMDINEIADFLTELALK